MLLIGDKKVKTQWFFNDSGVKCLSYSMPGTAYCFLSAHEVPNDYEAKYASDDYPANAKK